MALGVSLSSCHHSSTYLDLWALRAHLYYLATSFCRQRQEMAFACGLGKQSLGLHVQQFTAAPPATTPDPGSTVNGSKILASSCVIAVHSMSFLACLDLTRCLLDTDALVPRLSRCLACLDYLDYSYLVSTYHQAWREHGRFGASLISVDYSFLNSTM